MRRRLRSAAFPIHRHALPQLALDAGLVALAYYLAYRLRFDAGIPDSYSDLMWRTFAFAIVGSLVCFTGVGMYRHWMRWSSQREYVKIAEGVVLAVAALIGYVAVVQPQLILDRLRLRRAHGPDRRARALRPAAGRLPDRHALPRAPALPAALERLPAAPGRALGADRGRRGRRPAAAAGAAQEPRARLPARRLRRRRPEEEGHAGRARHDRRPAGGARRRRARRGDDRDPVGARHAARRGGQRLPCPRDHRPHGPDRLRAGADRRRADASAA